MKKEKNIFDIYTFNIKLPLLVLKSVKYNLLLSLLWYILRHIFDNTSKYDPETTDIK